MPTSTINEAANGFTHYIRFNYVDLQTSGFLSTIGAANQKKIDVLAPGDIVDMVAFYQVVDPAGATDLTLDVGFTSADPDDFIDNLDVDAMTQAVANTGDAFIGTDSGAATTSNVINCVVRNATTSVDMLMEFNGTVANLTAGEWVLAWRKASPSAWARSSGS